MLDKMKYRYDKGSNKWPIPWMLMFYIKSLSNNYIDFVFNKHAYVEVRLRLRLYLALNLTLTLTLKVAFVE